VNVNPRADQVSERLHLTWISEIHFRKGVIRFEPKPWNTFLPDQKGIPSEGPEKLSLKCSKFHTLGRTSTQFQMGRNQMQKSEQLPKSEQKQPTFPLPRQKNQSYLNGFHQNVNHFPMTS
jgi:hypothetical protein